MVSTLERILELSRELDDDERAELVRLLTTGTTLHRDRADEIDRIAEERSARARRGETQAIPWAEARETMFKRPA